MSFQMVNSNQRMPRARAKPWQCSPTTREPGRPGPRDCDGINFTQSQVGILQSLFYDRVDGFDELARGHLGKDAAEAGMQVYLRGDHTR
jgi:hypothetical protein